MNDLVYVVGSHTRPHFLRRNIEHLSCQPTDLAHSILLLLVQDRNLIPPYEYLLGARYPIFCIVRMLDFRRYLSFWRQRVYRPQSARKRKGREGVVLAVCWVGFRDNIRWKEITERITLCLVDCLMVALLAQSVFLGPSSRTGLLCTQFRLKQSCEQK
jgi:hypothetical protein